MIHKKPIRNLEVQLGICFKGSFLAGGAVLSIVTGQPISDYDIYPKTYKDAFDISEALHKNGQLVSITDRALTFLVNPSIIEADGGGRATVQVMIFDEFPTSEHIFKYFDFTVCMGAYDFDTSSYHYHELFMEDVAARRINFNTETKFPYASLIRLEKYQSKGFKVSPAERLKVAVAVAQHGVPKTWEEVSSTFGGFYGLVFKGLEHMNGVECNFENIISGLSGIEYSNHVYKEDDKVDSLGWVVNHGYDVFKLFIDKTTIEYFEMGGCVFFKDARLEGAVSKTKFSNGSYMRTYKSSVSNLFEPLYKHIMRSEKDPLVPRHLLEHKLGKKVVFEIKYLSYLCYEDDINVCAVNGLKDSGFKNLICFENVFDAKEFAEKVKKENGEHVNIRNIDLIKSDDVNEIYMGSKGYIFVIGGKNES